MLKKVTIMIFFCKYEAMQNSLIYDGFYSNFTIFISFVVILMHIIMFFYVFVYIHILLIPKIEIKNLLKSKKVKIAILNVNLYKIVLSINYILLLCFFNLVFNMHNTKSIFSLKKLKMTVCFFSEMFIFISFILDFS